MEDLRGLCAAAPTFAGAATSPLAEVFAGGGECVEVVADKRFAFAQDEHGYCIVADGTFRGVQVLCQVGSGDAFEHLAIQRLSPEAVTFVGADSAADEGQVVFVSGDEVDLVVAVRVVSRMLVFVTAWYN